MTETKTESVIAVDSLKQPPINWEDFNYPPCLKLFHYNINEVTDEQEKKTVKQIYASFLISLLSLAVNFTNAIALTLGGDNKGRIIFYSLLHFLIFSPISLYVFYHGYKSIVQEKAQLPNYLWQQLFCAICYFIFSIVKGGAFNGFTKTSHLFKSDLDLQAFLSLVESITYLFNSIYSLYLVYIVKQLQKQQQQQQACNDKNKLDKEIQL